MKIRMMCKVADGVVCERESGCAGCGVWEKALNQVSYDLDICQVCGADRKEYRERFGKEHVCFSG